MPTTGSLPQASRRHGAISRDEEAPRFQATPHTPTPLLFKPATHPHRPSRPRQPDHPHPHLPSPQPARTPLSEVTLQLQNDPAIAGSLADNRVISWSEAAPRCHFHKFSNEVTLQLQNDPAIAGSFADNRVISSREVAARGCASPEKAGWGRLKVTPHPAARAAG